VYIGSFNGLKPIREDVNPNCLPLFQKEQVCTADNTVPLPKPVVHPCRGDRQRPVDPRSAGSVPLRKRSRGCKVGDIDDHAESSFGAEHHVAMALL